MARRAVDRGERAELVTGAARKLFLRLPPSQVTVEAIGAESGMTYWQIYRFHGRPEDIYRAVVRELFQSTRASFLQHRPAGDRLADATASFVLHVARVMRGADFRDLIHLLVRGEPGLCEEYEQRVRALLRSRLAEIVTNAGARQGLNLVIPEQALRRIVRDLETEFAFGALLEQTDEAEDEAGLEERAKRITATTLAATCSLEALFAAA